MARTEIEATPERVAKLPRWVQWHIEDLVRRNRDLEISLATHRGKESRVRVDPRGSDSKPEYYARDLAQVSFLLGDDWQDFLDVRIETQPDGGRVLCVRGGYCIDVRPESGNVVTIKLRKD